jgi:pilus assembly protein CpaC
MSPAITHQLRRMRPALRAVSTRGATGTHAKSITAALAAFIIIILVAAPEAQQAPSFMPAPAATSPKASTSPLDTPTDVDLLVGRSTVLNVGAAITRVSLTVPDIADAMVTAPTQLLIHGKSPGTISLFVWDRSGAIKTYEVKVRRDLTALVQHIKQLFPGEPVSVIGSGKDVVLSGTVSSKYVIEKAADVAGGYVEKKENVVNLLKQQEGVASNQVMLRVRFAEVSRSAITELGATLFTGPGGFHDYIARTTTQQFSGVNLEEMVRVSEQGVDNWGGGRDTVTSTGGKFSLSDFLNIFVFNNKYNIGTVIRAMQEKGLFQSLAEPNLIALNGKEASFLAGGEFPYPVVQGGGANASVTIQFKEFGIRLNFTPTVLGGDLINLKVRPEVSSLDFANAVTVEGFRVPALSTRRTETEVELRDGQTFAIAGLLNNQVTDTMRKIPGIGDIPILGWLFKSKGMQKGQTELVVMITPVIVRRGSTGVSEGLPSAVEPWLSAPSKTLPPTAPYTGSPRYPANQPARPGGADAPQPQPRAQAPAQPASAPTQNVNPPAQSNAPLQSRPIQSPPPVSVDQPAVVAPVPAATPALTKDQVKQLEAAREEERQAALAADRERLEQAKREMEQQKVDARAEENRRAHQARVDAADAKKKEQERKQADEIAKARAKREAEEAKKQQEIARKKAEDDQKRERALTEAADRLKQAQAAYQAELEKAKGSSNDKTKKPGGGSNSPQR